ncbi:hypothetical protein FJT64_011517 [Amphibalanus amphitrite]|uniref:Uncharacterized protein n=1 Tax=Amphibalanus amphitrite TaxID=1232801 RepID=A0A6A4VLT8_AMPAM|nr:hypothetical protein FJT64_011517 [Amphibalanus amphitrite]
MIPSQPFPCNDTSFRNGFSLKYRDCIHKMKLSSGVDASEFTNVLLDSTAQAKDNKTLNDATKRKHQVPCVKYLLFADEFELHDDGTVYAISQDRHYSPDEYEHIGENVAICSKIAGFGKIGDTISIIALVFVSASMLCLCLHLAAFCLVPKLRNLPGKNLASFCVALLLSYTCLLAGPFPEVGSSSCRALAIIIYIAFIHILALDQRHGFRRLHHIEAFRDRAPRLQRRPTAAVPVLLSVRPAHHRSPGGVGRLRGSPQRPLGPVPARLRRPGLLVQPAQGHDDVLRCATRRPHGGERGALLRKRHHHPKNVAGDSQHRFVKDEPAAVHAAGTDHGHVVGDRPGRRLAALPAALVHLHRPRHTAGRLHLRLVHADTAREAGRRARAVALLRQEEVLKAVASVLS